MTESEAILAAVNRSMKISPFLREIYGPRAGMAWCLSAIERDVDRAADIDAGPTTVVLMLEGALANAKRISALAGELELALAQAVEAAKREELK